MRKSGQTTLGRKSRRKAKSVWKGASTVIIVLACTTFSVSAFSFFILWEKDMLGSDFHHLQGNLDPKFLASGGFLWQRADPFNSRVTTSLQPDPLATQSTTQSNRFSLIRGVAPNLQARYHASVAAEQSTSFRCLDGENHGHSAILNDDFCDCADGSDETSTAACAGLLAKPALGGGFFCRWASPDKQPLEVVRMSALNDGICDCCAGEDEWDTGVQCSNRCADVIRTETASHSGAVSGYAFREKYVSKAVALADQEPFKNWDGGPGKAFLAVASRGCLSLQTAPKTFKLCLFQEAVQMENELKVVLGRVGRWATFLWEDGSQKADYSHFQFVDGDLCATSGAPRQADVFFECSIDVGSFDGAKFVSASQTQTPHALEARLAMDENGKTRQGCGPSCEWIGDLGVVTKIVQIDIDWEACQCKRDGAALIEVSEDRSTWTVFKRIGGFHVWGGYSKRIYEGTASARYVRIKTTANIEEDWFAMWEITVNSRPDHLVSAKETQSCQHEFRVSTPAACAI